MSRSELLQYKAELVLHIIHKLTQRQDSSHTMITELAVREAEQGLTLLQAAGSMRGRSTPEEREAVDDADHAYQLLAGSLNYAIERRGYHVFRGPERKEIEKTAAKLEPAFDWIDMTIARVDPAVAADMAVALIEQIRDKLSDRMQTYYNEDMNELTKLRKENAELKQQLRELKAGKR